MGEQNVQSELDSDRLRAFTRGLLDDLRAFEQLLQSDLLETGIRRIGAEQEMFLTDRAWQPKAAVLQILEKLDHHPQFTTELGQFNLEVNLEPQVFGGSCLSKMEAELVSMLALAREAAESCDSHIALVGILPTLLQTDLSLDNLTPVPRYRALNEAINRLRGGPFEFRIKGPDELLIHHDSVMLEACNASFQVHFQVDPDEFAHFYNIAQVVTGPVLAAAVNSPMLFGRRLWRETRIALFQQSLDTRKATGSARDMQPRVSFGRDWVKESVTEIFQEDIARFRVLIGAEIDEDPFEALNAGRPPQLKALRLHNGTVYRWNRPCYGVAGGKGHLRIENRVLPSGPTPRDEVANAAFWFGLVSACAEEYKDVRSHFAFDEVRDNFLSAARLGLGAQFTWLGDKLVPARRLIRSRLLPMARQGLLAAGIDENEAELYLQIIDRRVDRERTGAAWMIKSFNESREHTTMSESLAFLTQSIVERQASNTPVHEWRVARKKSGDSMSQLYQRVEQFMVTDLFTVNEDELIDLAATMMDWKHIRHVPVEDQEHRLVGLVSHRKLLRIIARGSGSTDQAVSVKDVMERQLHTITPETHALDAIAIMRREKVSCLPVVKNERLVGIVTEHDFIDLAAQLLEQKLKEDKK